MLFPPTLKPSSLIVAIASVPSPPSDIKLSLLEPEQEVPFVLRHSLLTTSLMPNGIDRSTALASSQVPVIDV